MVHNAKFAVHYLQLDVVNVVLEAVLIVKLDTILIRLIQRDMSVSNVRQILLVVVHVILLVYVQDAILFYFIISL